MNLEFWEEDKTGYIQLGIISIHIYLMHATGRNHLGNECRFIRKKGLRTEFQGIPIFRGSRKGIQHGGSRKSCQWGRG